MCLSFTCITIPNLVILVETFERNYGDLTENFGFSRKPGFSGKLKVIETNTDRSATNNFLYTSLFTVEMVAQFI